MQSLIVAIAADALFPCERSARGEIGRPSPRKSALGNHRAILLNEMVAYSGTVRISCAGPAARIVSLCSFCQKIAWPVGAGRQQEEWIEAAE